MTNMFEDQKIFMILGNQTTHSYNEAQQSLYFNLINEECEELYCAVTNSEPNENILKEAIDVLVVTLGLIASYGIDANELWTIVYKNNLAKVSDKVIKDEYGKIMKSKESKARKEQMMKDIRGLLDAN